jgi:hypothetical protein
MDATHGSKWLRIGSLLGVLLVVAVFSPVTEVTAGVDRVNVCHVTDVPEQGDGHVITIADPAFDAHAAHGDAGLDDPRVQVDPDGFTCHVSAQPVAVDDEFQTPMNTPIEIDVLANDGYGDLGSVSVLPYTGNGIQVDIIEVGVFEYTPKTDFVGTDSFVYQICITGELCATATVNIAVGP